MFCRVKKKSIIKTLSKKQQKKTKRKLWKEQNNTKTTKRHKSQKLKKTATKLFLIVMKKLIKLKKIFKLKKIKNYIKNTIIILKNVSKNSNWKIKKRKIWNNGLFRNIIVFYKNHHIIKHKILNNSMIEFKKQLTVFTWKDKKNYMKNGLKKIKIKLNHVLKTWKQRKNERN